MTESCGPQPQWALSWSVTNALVSGACTKTEQEDVLPQALVCHALPLPGAHHVRTRLTMRSGQARAASSALEPPCLSCERHSPLATPLTKERCPRQGSLPHRPLSWSPQKRMCCDAAWGSAQPRCSQPADRGAERAQNKRLLYAHGAPKDTAASQPVRASSPASRSARPRSSASRRSGYCSTVGVTRRER